MIGIDNTLLLTVPLTVGFFLALECEGASYPGVSVFLSHRDRKMNVQYFNDLRRDIRAADMNELRWDLTMAKESRRLGRSCDFESRPDSRYSLALYKQLFDPTARPGEIIMNAIRFWASQKSNFTRFGWQSCEAQNTCEYIKMITATSNNAACSLTRCSSMRNQRKDEEANMYFVVCLFSPTTVTARPPYSLGRKCSRCPLYSTCRRGLCSLDGRKFLNATRPSSRDRNRIIKPFGDDKSSHTKGRILQGYRYLDSKGNIRIRQTPRYLAQKGRRPSYIERPTTHRRKQYRLSQQRAATTASRGRSSQAARVKRQTRRDDYRYQLLLRRREEQRRREEERERQEREHRRNLLAQQLRERTAAIRKSEDEDRRLHEEQRRKLEELRRQREEERLQAELERRREEERRRRERQRELERRRQERRRNRYAPARIESPMNSTDKVRLTQVHNTLRGTGMSDLKWNNHLERWARYVIRCEIEYPGPIDTFTNFGKIDKSSQAYNIVYDWGAEGNDVFQRLTSGCRTPDDRERCNHNVIIRNPFIRNFACASLDCVDKTQLTCIYK
ncbi:probable ATP-dependent RNA helicase DDX46 [Saccostrea echinata]|uniref:probable ATP-dependent RNA helicase DDX46 n=1 Tax=Saccostrea echinata TaxID=191078 RepID=UPI002A7F9D6F|nr:probable ATP-dependent RNA helicase DDX46 [Saccostrea echinata]